MHDGSQGICTRSFECNWANKALANKKIKFQQLVRCGNDGSATKICCKRSAEVACENNKEIAKNYGARAPQFIGGEVADQGDFPHVVALGYNDSPGEISYKCGGSLISKNFVLTGAVCVIRKINLPTTVKLGSVKVVNSDSASRDNEQNIGVKNIVIHPYYTSKRIYNDIALIELASPAVFSKDVYPACLYTSSRDIAETLYATGWGVSDLGSGKTSEDLLIGALSYVPLDECNELYSDILQSNNKKIPDGIISTQICTLDKRNVEERISACQGDSGKA